MPTRRSAPRAKSVLYTIVAFGVVVVGIAATPFYLSNPFKVYLLAQILLLAIFALSFDLLYGYAGMLSLGQSVYFGLGAYGTGLLLRHTAIPIGGTLLLAVCLATVAALIFGVLAVRVRGHGFIIITAVTTLVMYLLGVYLSPLTGGDNGLRYMVPPLFGQSTWRLNGPNPVASFYAVLPCFVMAYSVLWWLLCTPLGRSFLLLRDNEERAEVLGYPVQRLKLLVFVIAGVYAGFAGGLYALVNGYVAPSLLRWTFAAEAIIWTLLGGAGTLIGPVLGTALLMLGQEWLKDVWPYGYPLLLGLVLLLVVRFFPRGIVGTLQEQWRQRRQRAAGSGG